MLPLLPVLSTQLSVGMSVAHVSENVPVLHMAFADMPVEAIEALATLGVFILDASVLGMLSYSTEIEKLLVPR